MQKKELFLWTCSTNQANPQCVMARRLTEAHPWEVTKRKKSFLCWIWEEAAPALSFMGLLPLALLSSPSLQTVARHKPPWHLEPSHPLPSAHHHLLTTTPHSSAPIPCPLQIHSPLCHFIPSAVTLPLAPRSPFSPGKARGGEGKGFPSSVQKCSSVSKDKACPLCNPPAAAATKAGRGGGWERGGHFVTRKEKP